MPAFFSACLLAIYTNADTKNTELNPICISLEWHLHSLHRYASTSLATNEIMTDKILEVVCHSLKVFVVVVDHGSV